MTCYSSQDLKKPLSYEKCDYELRVLDNGVKILLASSPDIDKAAASISVRVGSFHEPDEYNGLAHFCEHMLFMGSEKYPDEAEYSQFIQQNGGFDNAFTSSDQTVYYAAIKADALEGLFDRLAQFFISPKFYASSVDREVEAVNSEFNKDLGIDEWRECSLIFHTGNPKHVASRFTIGNNTTLRRLDKYSPEQSLMELRNALLAFHERYYSSNVMNVCVIGREPLDQLREMTVSRMSQVQNKNVTVPHGVSFGTPFKLFTDEYLLKRTFLVPLNKEKKVVAWHFVIPDSFNLWKEKPDQYLTHYIGHEGSRSIISILRRMGLARELHASDESNFGQSLLMVDISLTDEGVKQIGQIGEILFAYLRLLLERPVSEAIEADRLHETELRWKYNSFPTTDKFVVEAARTMNQYPPEHIFDHSLVFKHDVPMYTAILKEMLQADQFNMLLIGESYKDICTSRVPYWDTPYHTESIPAEWIERWQGVNQLTAEKFQTMIDTIGLGHPEPNVFIPEDLNIRHGGAADDADPNVIKTVGSVYHLCHTRFNLPRAEAHFLIHVPWLSPTDEEVAITAKDPLKMQDWSRRTALLDVVFAACRISLEEILYYANLLNIAISMNIGSGLSIGPVSIKILLKGFHDRLGVGLDILLSRLRNFHADVTDQQIKLALIQKITAYAAATTNETPITTTIRHAGQFVCADIKAPQTILEALKSMTVEDVRKFDISEAFKGASLSGLVVGNLSTAEAENSLSCPEKWKDIVDPMPEDRSSITKAVDLAQYRHLCTHSKVTSFLVHTQTANVGCTDNAVAVAIQFPDLSIESRVLVRMVHLWLAVKFFDDLRTRQQLGYIVRFSKSYVVGRTYGTFAVQSQNTCNDVAQRIFKFLEEYLYEGGSTMLKITDDEFETFRNAAIAGVLETPHNLDQIAGTVLAEIESEQFEWTSRKKQAAYLKTYTLETFRQDVKRWLTRAPWLTICCHGPNDATKGEPNVDWVNFKLADHQRALFGPQFLV